MKTQLEALKELNRTLALFVQSPSAQNFNKLNKAMLDYQNLVFK